MTEQLQITVTIQELNRMLETSNFSVLCLCYL